MNHYIIKSEGGMSRVHVRADSLAGAVKDVMIYARVAGPEVEWWVLSTSRDLSVGSSLGGDRS